LKTILIEEIGSGTSLTRDKDSSASVVKDDALSTPKDLTGTFKDSSATTQRESTAVKSSPPITAKYNSAVVKNVSHTTEHLSAEMEDISTQDKEPLVVKKGSPFVPKSPSVTTPKQQQLPAVPSSSITFIHDWKRLRPHPDLQSNYFQVIILLKN